MKMASGGIEINGEMLQVDFARERGSGGGGRGGKWNQIFFAVFKTFWFSYNLSCNQFSLLQPSLEGNDVAFVTILVHYLGLICNLVTVDSVLYNDWWLFSPRNCFGQADNLRKEKVDRKT